MNIIDFLRRAKRGPQIIHPKDTGIIVSETGCNKNWKIVDAGTGSGFLALFLGNLGCKVYTYENQKRFYEIAKRNIKDSGLKNIKLKLKDITKGISEKNVDMITLDMKDDTKVVGYAYNALKKKGFLVIYSMHIEKMQNIFKELKKYNFRIKILENIQREWQIEGETFTRPKSRMIGHTGFLIIARKI
jgi:tRNA (adenine57-N1/adenine58-N1)-methyltransferase